MGCAESRNTVQPHGAFSVVTPGSSTNTTTSTAITTATSDRFFHRNNSNNGRPATQKKHKPNALVPEPQGPTAPPETAVRAPAPSSAPSGPTTPPGSSGPLFLNACSTSPSVTAITNVKPTSTTSPPSSSSSSSPSPPLLVKGPSLQLLPSDKQNLTHLTHLTLDELRIQFLKAVKNGDLAYMGRVAQQAAKTKNNLTNIRGMWESTPLIYACQYCHPKAAMWLLEQGASVHLQNEKGVTPLLLASLEGMTDVVDWVLKQYADHVAGDLVTSPPATGSDSGVTAVVVINIDKQVGVVYNSVADLNIRLNPLLAAAMNGHVDIVAKLLAHKASVNCGVPASASVVSSKQFALLLAAKYGHASVVRILIKHGADFATSDATGNHALLLACEASKEECAMELLRLLPATPAALASPSSSQSLAQESEADKDQSPVVPSPRSNSYVTAWKQANSHGLTALHFAAANGLFSVVQSMLVHLQWGSDHEFLNATSVNRRECALLMACRKRQSEVVQLLVSVGADFELADRGGTTALQVLKRDKKDELVKLCESRKLDGGGGGQQQQQQQLVSRTASVCVDKQQANGNLYGQSEKQKEKNGDSNSGYSLDETMTTTKLAIDVTEDQELLLDSQQVDKQKAERAVPAAKVGKLATQFDWDDALGPVIPTATLAGSGDGSDATPVSLAREPSSRLKSMALSGSSRTTSFSPNVIHTTNLYGQKQQEILGDATPELQTSPLAEDQGAEWIEPANSIEIAKSGGALVDRDEEKPSEPVAVENGPTATARTESHERTSLDVAAKAPPGDADGDSDDKRESSPSRRKKEAPSASKPKQRKKEHSPRKTRKKDAAGEDANEDTASSSRGANTSGIASRVSGFEGPEEGRAAAASLSDAPFHQGKDHYQSTANGDEGDDTHSKTPALKTSGGETEAPNSLDLTQKALDSGTQKPQEGHITADDDWGEPSPTNVLNGEPSPTNVLNGESTGVGSSRSVLKTASNLVPLPSLPATALVESEDELSSSSPKKRRQKKKKSSHTSKKSKQSAMTSASSSSLEFHAESNINSNSDTTTRSVPSLEIIAVKEPEAPTAALESHF